MMQAREVGAEIPEIEVRIPSRAEWVALARLTVATVAARMHFNVDEIADLKLAVAEACTNAIQHARESDEIVITCRIYDEGMQVTIRDFGVGTEAERIRSRDLGEPRVGGLGVYLIRALMDEVEYSVEADSGTVLTMFKRLGDSNR
ncbi:MAG: histidine kinase [Candidatus Eremiobacteraeota bacterium]|uniref:Switch protein/serine kinase and anti-sigma factor (Inhibitory sigma-B binding protein) n=1 Tax=mine drainage metagenome TaxID=410659 RepID=E6Q789_9ZZZZ|nr:ATP-binding protein [Candidatus Eremiobacteraeota bacterium]NNM91985.1 histidine kinase [Candidatus Eremiobacteraeota bacterium]